MSDLADFLLARIAEDEEVARAAYGVRWSVIEGVRASLVLVHSKEIHDDHLGKGHLGHVATVTHEHDLAHIARHDPARVLAECEAKRRIVEHTEPDLIAASPGDPHVLRLLALPYRNHPDYRSEWAP